MYKPKITFRKGVWVVASGIYPGCPVVYAEGISVPEAWDNYVRTWNAVNSYAIQKGYSANLPGNPGDVCFIEIEQERTSLLERVRRFFHG
ncbi:hypothetical protein [Enterobacter hormaechei]|uniref:hypothetical protein n=1 Tax=Enterobacter hormaechei TaxID=158836 RepID=UPI0039060CEE